MRRNVLSNMSIGKRVGLGFSAVLMLAVLLAAIGIRQLASVTAATHFMMQQPLTKERLIAEWHGVVGVAVQRTTAVARSNDLSLGPYFAAEESAAAKHAAELRKKIEPQLSTDDEKQLFQKIMQQVQIFRSAISDINELKAVGKTDEAARVFQGTYLTAANSYLALIDQLLELQKKNIDATASNIDASGSMSVTLLTMITLLVLMVGIVFGWRLTVGITLPLRIAVDAAGKVAAGDLTGKIVSQSSDETGQLLQSLKEMNQNLLNMVGNVRACTDSIATASSQIAAGNLDLSARTEQQAGSLEETASTMEELTSAVRHNANNANQANQLALSAADVAQRGGEVVSQVVETMNAISISSVKINDIIGVIDGIAFQTNILALNAAVEAARAGEQGRGFAVVASEVRNLAQRSASAAKEIKLLINDTVVKVNAGGQLVQKAGTTMNEIQDSIQRVTAIMADISTASREQNSGIEQINQAIAQMDQVTQQNAALVEQAAAAADSLQHQADNLSQLVGVFRLSEFVVDHDGGPAGRSDTVPYLTFR